MLLVDVNEWGSASRDSLPTVTCNSSGAPKGGSCQMSRNSLIFSRPPLTARGGEGGLQRRTMAKCFCQQRCGTLGVVGHCEEFDPVLVHRARMEEKDFVDKMKVYDVVPRSDAAKEGCRVIRTRWALANKRSDDKPRNARSGLGQSCDSTRGPLGWAWRHGCSSVRCSPGVLLRRGEARHRR